MQAKITRRRFLRTQAAAAAALAAPALLPRRALGASEKLNVAGIGIGGKGESDVALCSGENIVALCDVDDRRAAGTFSRFPHAARYRDYRKMLESEEKRIDAVTVSTPDHVHAPASVMAMRLGKHVYCQKPLTHSVREARVMAEVAREMKVATQMGNQGFSHPITRRLAELVRAGVLGKAREAHVWTDRPIWPQGIARPEGSPSIPVELSWDLWLGPAPERPYHPAYLPFNWRGWWDFGTGALGDMGCHNFGLPFLALDLRDPSSVAAESSPVNQETAPKSSVITFEFPARGSRPPLKMVWYDGGRKPSPDLVKGRELPSNGVIIAGDKDTLYVPSYWGGGEFLSGAKLEDFKEIAETLPRRASAARGDEPDIDAEHHLEWLAACKGGPKPLSSFDLSGPMTEMVLLGNVALRAGERFEWNAKELRTNLPPANRFIRREYRKGWEL